MTRRSALSTALAVLGALLVPSIGSAAPLPYEQVVRVAGDTAREAAIEVSQALHVPDSAGAVVLAREDTFPDALGASALTADVDGPLLLTPPNRLADATRDEIARVLPDGGTVYLLGGELALSPQVERDLDDLGYRTPRFPGRDRVETAAMIARFVGEGSQDRVLLVRASGNPDLEQGWVDSVSCGGFAASRQIPVLLTRSDQPTVDPETLRTIDVLGVRRVDICGGAQAIPESQATQLRGVGLRVERHAGADRAGTAVAVAAGLWDVSARDGASFVLVPGYGQQFGFGLVAARLSAALGAPILLVDRDEPTACTDERAGVTICLLESGDAPAEALVVVGGTQVISDAVLVAAAEAGDLAKDTTAPPVPGGLVVTDKPEDDGKTLVVSWNPVQDASGEVTYTVYARRTDADGDLTRANAVGRETTGTSLALTGLTAGVGYDVAIDARDLFGNRSALSAVVAGTPTDEIPASPPSDVGPSVAVEGSGIRITWPAAPEADVVAYDVQRLDARADALDLGDRNCDPDDDLFGADWETIATIAVPATSHVDTTGSSGTPYCYRYRPVDSTGNPAPEFSGPGGPLEHP